MGSTIVAIATVVALTLWHLYTRRLPAWQASADGRFYVTLGYPMVAIAVYWLASSPTNTDWEWALGNVWALAAMVSFVRGFAALNAIPEPQKSASEPVESISAS